MPIDFFIPCLWSSRKSYSIISPAGLEESVCAQSTTILTKCDNDPSISHIGDTINNLCSMAVASHGDTVNCLIQNYEAYYVILPPGIKSYQLSYHNHVGSAPVSPLWPKSDSSPSFFTGLGSLVARMNGSVNVVLSLFALVGPIPGHKLSESVSAFIMPLIFCKTTSNVQQTSACERLEICSLHCWTTDSNKDLWTLKLVSVGS